MTPSTHECPAPGCAAKVPFVMLACRPHWSAVPVELQRKLLREYSHSFGERSDFEARAAACLRALGVPEDGVASLNGGIAWLRGRTPRWRRAGSPRPGPTP